jgi:hypothetical protein
MRWPLFLLLVAGCRTGAMPGGTMDATIITRSADLEAAVGKQVSLQGTVENSRIATLVGVDVESESPDLRGQPAIASGVLERVVVSQEDIDREVARHGQFAHRGPGTTYRLIDSATGRLAQVRPSTR